MWRVLLILFVFVVPIWNLTEVHNVDVVAQSETELTLKWFSNSSNLYILRDSYRRENNISAPYQGLVRHTVSSLSPGTKYTFTLYTVFEDVRSNGYNFSAVTTPLNVDSVIVSHQDDTNIALFWFHVNNDPQYDYILQYGDTETFIKGYYERRPLLIYTVSSLFPGTTYTFTIYTVFEDVRSSGYRFSATTTPSSVFGLYCVIAISVLGALFIIVLSVCLGFFCQFMKLGLRRSSSEESRKVSNDQPTVIYVNACSHNTQGSNNPSLQSECKEIKTNDLENHQYETPDMIMPESTADMSFSQPSV
ncbi:receptor-type tyrosine-protein phosphatase eta-like [Myxocyprinus asiaticus]|uniref:receptor-type tyrosine-protein phosphatase eta-like n=1 Tax=Myxocyprinus asiaticus TaxID=70543 RepID=UPI0022213CBE|nr:receptor-type tyrosine-protein phosphatase eta-like [Myxocyprinus asiaticus]